MSYRGYSILNHFGGFLVVINADTQYLEITLHDAQMTVDRYIMRTNNKRLAA